MILHNIFSKKSFRHMAAKMASVIGIGAVAMALSSCSDDNFDIDSPTGGIVPDGMTELTLSMNISAEEAQLRSRSVDFAAKYITVDSVWVGVYDNLTGERVGTSAFYVGQGAGADATLNSQNAKINIVYYDAHPEVRIVAVANYSGVKSATEGFGTLESELAAADTWAAFKKVSFEAPDANAPQNNERPLLMGFYYNKSTNKPEMLRVNQFSDEGKGANVSGEPENGISLVKLVNTNQTYDSQFGKMQELKGTISLRRLGMNANVTVKGGSGVSISNVSYQVVNMPQSGYIAPRRVITLSNYPGGAIDDFDKWQNNSPNKADAFLTLSDGKITDVNGAYTDGEVTKLEAKDGVYSFSFQHLENLHWALDAATNDYSDRGKAYRDNGTVVTDVTGRNVLAALCPDGDDFNNMASAIILTMDVEAPKAKGTVTYYIPEGYCNDESGVASAQNASDFTSVRNTNYNYTITINGLNDLAVDVTTGDFVRDDITGSKFGVSPMNNNTLTLMDDVASNIGYRLYQVGTDGKVIADIYNFNPTEEPFTLLTNFWEPFSQESNGNTVTVSLKAEDGTSATLDEFVKNAKPGSYTVEFGEWTSSKGDPTVAYCRLYIFEISQLQKGNGNVVYSQTSPVDTRPTLPQPSDVTSKNSLSANKFVDKYLNVTLPALTFSDPTTALEKYNIMVRFDSTGDGNPDKRYYVTHWPTSDWTEISIPIPVAELRNNSTIEYCYAPSDDDVDYVSAGWKTLGTLSITAPTWTKGDTEWNSVLSAYSSANSNEYHYSGGYLYFESSDPEKKFTGNISNGYLALGGGANTITLTVYKNCALTINANVGSNGDRGVQVKIDDKDAQKEQLTTTAADKTFNITDVDSNKGAKIVINGYSGGINVYSISLSDIK